MISEARQRVISTFEEIGTVSGTARKLGLSRGTVQEHLKKAGIDKPLAAGAVKGTMAQKYSLPRKGTVKRYILTSAQSNTYMNGPVWQNLLALADHYNAKVMVSRFTYNMNAYGKLSVKPGTDKHQDHLWYDPEIADYVVDERIELAPGLVWCGEMNILPTAERPLQGFENYTGRASGIFPHVKLAMQSIAAGKSEPTKFNYTTGTVTRVNYIQKKAGLKAEFHHCYGGLLVEVDSAGDWWVRQLNASSNGTMYDMDLMAQGGKVTSGHRVEAITWGDIHADMLDPMVKVVGWGQNGMLDTLKPKFQFFHDTVNFGRRNHHEMNNPHRMFENWVNGEEDVEQEMLLTAAFLGHASRSWCQSVVVDSNHDNALTRWLKEADFRKDPVNAVFYLETQGRKYRSIKEKDKDFHLVEWVLKKYGAPENIKFLREDESFVICRGSRNGIECGMHGDLGPNGSRGSPANLSKLGRRKNIGHVHSACIMDGLYAAGTSSLLDLKYNRGPSSWSHSHIVTYANGKRAIYTMWRGRFRA